MKKKILCLMMAAILAVGAPLTAFARDYQGADGWQATFDCSKLNSNFKDEDVTDSMSEIQPGDLLFYASGKTINHVALYIGNGQIVHASTERTGIKVSRWNYRTPVRIVNVLGD